MIYKSLLLSVLLILISITFSYSAGNHFNNRERIISYDSDITINKDGSMDVVEVIKVHSEAVKIKRGIFRDFPTKYEDKYGNNIVIKFEVIEILRDGRGESYHTESQSNGVRVYIGDSNVFLKSGDYSYTIKYKTNRQIGFFEDFDELYWNVTGNGWDFVIENASVVVNLPNGINRSEIKIDGFTGYQGSAEKDYKGEILSSSKVKLKTTRKLNSTEGFTILVQFPKGFVNEPSASDKFGYFIQDNIPSIIGLIGVVILLIYYSLIWLKVGKDPQKGTIIPLFEPPSNISPAAARFLTEMGYDDKVFTSAIINLAVKGFIKIEEDDSDYSLVKIGNGNGELSKDEKKLYSKLSFKKKTSLFDGKEKLQLELKQENHAVIKKSITTLKKSLKNSYEKTYFITNLKYFILGMVISVIILIAAAMYSSADLTFSLVWTTFWSMGVSILLFTVFKAWRGVVARGKVKVGGILAAIFITLFSIPFVAGEIFGLFLLATEGSPLLIVVIGIIALANVIFYHLLKAPTLLGRKLMDQIEGFKMYLSVAEVDNLVKATLPEKTTQLFEKYLPYALALNVENEWSEKFSDMLAEINDYSPDWYNGAAISTLGAAGFASSLGSSFSSTISSSSTAPGSSSGSSGGSSGGGGGGGGGGGW